MSEFSWAPAETVAGTLGGAAGPRAWRNGAVWGEGGVWAPAAAGLGPILWPVEFPPPARRLAVRPPALHLPSRGFFAALWGAIAWLFSFGRSRARQAPAEPAPAPLPAAAPGALVEQLTALHAWVGKENLRAATDWFSPCWYHTPTPLAAVTQQGANWTLLAYHLATWGPEDKPASLEPLVRVGPSTSIADCLALHLHIERLVLQAGESLRLVPPDPSPRRPGGLRTHSFLAIWPALTSSREGEVWAAELRRLAAVSPLTQLVYTDLLPATPEAAPPSLLFPKDPEAPGASPEDDAVEPARQEAKVPGNPADAPEGSAWLDLWISHLARSLVGALLTPPQSWEALLRAEWELQRAEERSRRGAAEAEAKVKIAVATQHRDECASRLSAEYRPRLAGVASMLRANVFFALRFTDMFIRQIVADCGPQIASAWKDVKAKAEGRATEEPRNLFFFPCEGVPAETRFCFQAFERALFGVKGMPAGQADEELRRELFSFLPPAEPDAAVLRRRCGVPEQGCRDLLARYQKQQTVLPIRFEDGHTPTYLLQQWIAELVGRIPETAVETASAAEGAED